MFKKFRRKITLIAYTLTIITFCANVAHAEGIQNDKEIEGFNSRMLQQAQQLETSIKSSPTNNMANVRDFGAKGNGISDDTDAIIRALQTGRPVFLPKGRYKVNKSINYIAADKITLIGESGTVIDGTNSRAEILVSLGGDRLTAAPLMMDAKKGAKTLVARVQAAPGETVLVTASDLWNSARAYYYKGELAVVEGASGSLQLKTPLYDNYRAAGAKVYKLKTPQVYVANIEIIRNSNQQGLSISYAKNVLLENCKISGARERAFNLAYVVNGVIKNNSATDCWYSGTGTSYGLCVASSQNIVVKGNRFIGGRAAVSCGGWEPYREILITGNVIDNYHPSGQSALGLHENGELVLVKDNQILNGICPRNVNLTIANNTIIGANRPAIYYWNENKYCDYIVIKNNNIQSTGSYIEGICISPVEKNTKIHNLDISGNKFDTQGDSINIQPHHSGVSGSVIERMQLQGNLVKSKQARALSISNTESDFYRVENLVLDSNTFNGKVNLAANPQYRGNIIIKGSKFLANSSKLDIIKSGFNKPNLMECYFAQ